MSGSWFRTTRNVELSTIYYLETEIGASWSNVNVVKSFKNAYDVAVPVVCIRLLDANSARLEVGATTLDNEYMISIDLFGKSDGQRLDLTDFIVDKLKDSWVYYLFSHATGNNSQMVKTADGRCLVRNYITNTRVNLEGNAVESQDRFRQNITILVRKSI